LNFSELPLILQPNEKIPCSSCQTQADVRIFLQIGWRRSIFFAEFLLFVESRLQENPIGQLGAVMLQQHIYKSSSQ